MPSEYEKPIVLVDVDGVLADFDGAVVNQLKELGMETPDPALRDHHNILSAYPENYRDVIQDIIHSHDFFNNIEPYDDALIGWERLLSLDYNPMICTSPIPNHQRSIEAKREWIRDRLVPHFGANVLNLAQITLDKHLVYGDILIDDRPTIKHAETAHWRHVLFDRQYNRHIVTHLRLRGWTDARMKDILQQAEEL